MKRRDLQEFIYFITRSKHLSRAQQRKRDTLLARDYSHFLDGPNRGHLAKEGRGLENAHNPHIVVAFLHQFTENRALKFTTHYWDKNSDGQYPYSSFEEFKAEYKKILDGGTNRPLSSIDGLTYEDHLMKIMSNFLVADRPQPWSKFGLKVGYNNYLKKWMDDNPNMQPFSMPLSELPESMRPTELIKGKHLVYFSDVVDVFKRCIEFRDNDFYFSVKRIFGQSSDFIINRTLLETLRGRSFYTDTELVIRALEKISYNIFQRPQFPNLDIRCELIRNEGNQIIRLKITQIDSFSDKDINDPKIIAADSGGDLYHIISFLRNLCDFSVISRFRKDNELKFLKIDYLSNFAERHITEVNNDQCSGFSYVLNFYIYTNE